MPDCIHTRCAIVETKKNSNQLYYYRNWLWQTWRMLILCFENSSFGFVMGWSGSGLVRENCFVDISELVPTKTQVRRMISRPTSAWLCLASGTSTVHRVTLAAPSRPRNDVNRPSRKRASKILFKNYNKYDTVRLWILEVQIPLHLGCRRPA